MCVCVLTVVHCRITRMCVSVCVSVTPGYCARPTAASAVLQAECELSNDKKSAAKRVSELSSELFFTIFVRVSFVSFPVSTVHIHVR